MKMEALWPGFASDYMTGVAKTVTNIRIHFQPKTPFWFKQLTQHQQYKHNLKKHKDNKVYF